VYSSYSRSLPLSGYNLSLCSRAMPLSLFWGMFPRTFVTGGVLTTYAVSQFPFANVSDAFWMDWEGWGALRVRLGV
jgi:hypothetical protein